MIPAPIPVTDAQRLASLRALEILDTPSEERFDNIVRLVADLFEAPISYISLVDENRQWLKSRIGLDFCESDRSSSFCGHAILEKEALVIPDTLKDARFHDNPMVTGAPFARFYVGQPLTAPDGHTIGTLCLMDQKPREFTARDRQVMKDIAKLVEREVSLLDTIRLQASLIETKDQLLRTEQNLAKELAEAAEYVKKLLPAPMEGEVAIDWVFYPSLHLGGDAFGYHWIENGDLLLYLIDACGHGVGPALLSVSVINLLKAHGVGVDLGNPGEVLTVLNKWFPMEQQHGLYFTMWLGVYRPTERRLTFASGGHPPAILRRVDGRMDQLETEDGPPVGMVDREITFGQDSIIIEGKDTLYIFSDGAYELPLANNRVMQLDAFEEIIRSFATPPSPRLLHERLREICAASGVASFPDDLSIMRIQFG